MSTKVNETSQPGECSAASFSHVVSAQVKAHGNSQWLLLLLMFVCKLSGRLAQLPLGCCCTSQLFPTSQSVCCAHYNLLHQLLRDVDFVDIMQLLAVIMACMLVKWTESQHQCACGSSWFFILQCMSASYHSSISRHFRRLLLNPVGCFMSATSSTLSLLLLTHDCTKPQAHIPWPRPCQTPPHDMCRTSPVCCYLRMLLP